MGFGATAAEKDNTAKAEIGALWLAINKRLAARQRLAKKKGLAP
jgi:hypothetical protein